MIDQSKNTQKITFGAFLVAGLSLIICSLVNGQNGHLRLENDVAQAVIAARYLAAGDGYLTDSLYYPENYSAEVLPVPQTVFPPGQALLITAVEPLVGNPLQTSFVVALVSMFLTPLAVYFFLVRCGMRVSIAVMGCLMWCGLVSAWENTFHCKSDITFVLLTVIGGIALVRPAKRSVTMAFVAGTLAALAFLVRYAGLFFMLAAALTIIVEWYRHRTKTQFMELVAFCIPAGLSVAVLFGRNYYFTGDLKGGNSYRPDKVFEDSARELYYAIVELFGASHIIDWRNPMELVLIAAVLLGCGLVWKHRGEIEWNRLGTTAFLDARGFLFSLIYSVTTVALLVYLELTTCVGLRARMFMSVVPFCMLMMATVLQLARIHGNTNSHFRLVGVLLAVAFLMGQVKQAPRVFATRPNYSALHSSCEQIVAGNTTLCEFLQSKISTEHPVLANEPQVLGAIIERPVVGLAADQYTRFSWTADEVLQRVRKFNVEWVVNFKHDEIQASEKMPFYQGLTDEDFPSWMELYQANSHYQLFRVTDVR